MSATTQLEEFPNNGIQWGHLGDGEQFRHAGLSAEEVGKIVPNELYAGAEGEGEGEDMGEEEALSESEEEAAKKRL